VLLRVLPEDASPFPDSPGAQVVVNTCLSGGALEIFLEPMLPAPLVEIVGRTPVADAIVAIAGILDYATARSLPGAIAEHAAAVVVASHGRDEEAAIRAALAAGVPYIALVASRKRGTAVLDELGLTEQERARIRTPAGLDLGSRTAAEVALSILAEVVASVRSRTVPPAGAFPAPSPPASASGFPPASPLVAPAGRPPLPLVPPRTAVDPVCGMTVTIMPDTPHLRVDGVDWWFCNPGCRDRYAAGKG
jgi:xanthine dehydrogenase accessory factor